MRVYVDADACPVVHQTVAIARERGIPVTLLCDTSHEIASDYAQVEVIGAGADAVDFALVNRCSAGDIVVTQDYGVAAMAMGRGAHPIHQSGMWYTKENIDVLLAERHFSKKARLSHRKHHIKGPSKRTAADDRRYEISLARLLDACGAKGDGR